MPFSFVKAIKSSHRHPINRILHCIGFPIYVTGTALILGDLFGLHTNPVNGVILWSIAIGLFLLGHRIEGNLRAMTLIVIFKYVLRSSRLTKSIHRKISN
jgi:uncharacterized membrane protein YGL010W